MRNAKDYWTPIYNDLIHIYPEINERIIDWYPSGQMEIAVKLDDGKKYVYDWKNKVLFPSHDDVDDNEPEDRWRRRFSIKLNRKIDIMGMSQETLSELTGISRNTISKYTNGKTTPSAYNLRKIANALRCSVSELIY